MKRASQLLMIAGLLVLAADQAQAQMLKWEDRVFLNVDFAAQNKGATDLATTSTFTKYDETGQVSTAQTVESSGGLFAVSGGVRVFGNFGVGAGFGTLSKDGSATITAKVPHPLFYDQPRTATATVDGLAHKETAFHVMAVFVLPLSGKFDVALSAGPSFYSIEQGNVTSAQIGDDFAPYTTIALASVTKVTTKKNAVGYNAGVDATFRVTKHLGLGVFGRYTGASADITPEGTTESITIKAGGLQVGGGLRVRF